MLRKASLALVVLALLLGVAGCADGLSGLKGLAGARTRIGVMANTDVGWITETRPLERALRFYRQNDVRAVVITGSVTKNGYKDQFDVLDKVWQKVFGGTDVRLILKDGRYDVDGFAFAVSAARPHGACDVLTFYGEGRKALTDEFCYYPRDARAVFAGSMHGVEVARHFEGWGQALPDGKVRPGPLAIRALSASQGLLVSVFSDSVQIRRLDFSYGEPEDRQLARELKRDGLAYAADVADPWIVDEPANMNQVPQFWGDTRIQLRRGQDREGRICTVIWPSVQKRFTGVRARQYEVSLVYPGQLQRPQLTKSVLTDGFFLPEERDANGGRCVFRESELPRGDATHREAVFAVTPLGPFGKRGKTFFSDPLPLTDGSLAR